MGVEISKYLEGEQLTVCISGRLDALAVKDVEKSIKEDLTSDEEISEVLIDMEKTEYISSAGLKFLLATYKEIVKRGGNMTVFRPTDMVMEVFSVTGFDNLIPIENSAPHLITKEDHRVYPLRPIQRWMMDTHFNKVKSTMMNMGGIAKIDNSVDMEILKEAINMTLHDHDIFRCRFVLDKETGDIMQRFDGDISDIDIEIMTDDELTERLKNLREPFEIMNGSLWRVRLLQSESFRYFFVNIYHVIMDGVGVVLLFLRDIDRYYKALQQGKSASEIRRSSSSYAAYIREENNISDEEMKEGELYWKKMLEGYSRETCIPPADKNGKSQDEELEFPIEGLEKGFFKSNSYNESAFFMGAVMLAMAKATKQKKAIISWVHNGRTTAKELKLMGIMLEQPPIRWDFDEDMSIESYVAAIDERMKEQIKHRRSLAAAYEGEMDSRMVCFIMQKGAIGRRGEVSLGGVKSEIINEAEDEESVAESSMDIELNAYDDGRYSIVFDYDSGSYSESAIENLSDMIKDIIEKMKQGCSLFEILK